MKYLFLTLISLLSVSGGLHAQTGDSILTIVLTRNVRPPHRMINKTESLLFSLKFNFGESRQPDSIEYSKYTPAEMIPAICNKAIYRNVHWEKLFKRPVKKGDVILVPIAVYNGEAQQTFVQEFTWDDLFKFGEENRSIANCLVMPTLVLKYGTPKH